jgi:hypothetical protein
MARRGTPRLNLIDRGVHGRGASEALTALI